MTITPAAQNLLKRLLNASGKAVGFAFDGAVGSCRASVPILRAVDRPVPDRTPRQVQGFTFYVLKDYEEVFDHATMDHETGLFSRGLNLTWPHSAHGCPNCREH